MRLTADGYGAVFDVKQELFDGLKDVLEDPKNDWLTMCDEVPGQDGGVDLPHHFSIHLLDVTERLHLWPIVLCQHTRTCTH